MAADPVPGAPNGTPATRQGHCDYVWRNFLAKSTTKSANRCAAEKFAVVAHSAGGRLIAGWTDKFKVEFLERVEALVFTDAYYHGMFKQVWTKAQLERLSDIGLHFKAYKTEHKAVGVPFKTSNGAITEVSAGTDVHYYTTGLATHHALNFIIG